MNSNQIKKEKSRVAREEKNKEISFTLYKYELDNIIKALESKIMQYEGCIWEMQKSGQYWYTPNTRQKQLEYTYKKLKKLKEGNQIKV